VQLLMRDVCGAGSEACTSWGVGLRAPGRSTPRMHQNHNTLPCVPSPTSLLSLIQPLYTLSPPPPPNPPTPPYPPPYPPPPHRLQVHRQFRKPLIVFSPKNLLRHPKCKSSLEEFDDVPDDQVGVGGPPLVGNVLLRLGGG
jgi:hypothetical protein